MELAAGAAVDEVLVVLDGLELLEDSVVLEPVVLELDEEIDVLELVDMLELDEEIDVLELVDMLVEVLVDEAVCDDEEEVGPKPG